MVDMGILVGSMRRFGLSGPAYEVLGPTTPSEDGEAQMRIRVFESAELLDYPLRDVLSDPTED